MCNESNVLTQRPVLQVRVNLAPLLFLRPPSKWTCINFTRDANSPRWLFLAFTLMFRYYPAYDSSANLPQFMLTAYSGCFVLSYFC